jgi:hypothetical protein
MIIIGISCSFFLAEIGGEPNSTLRTGLEAGSVRQMLIHFYHQWAFTRSRLLWWQMPSIMYAA